MIEISQERADMIIDTYEPYGRFYLKDDNGKWVGIDNLSGDAWTEEFDSLEECKGWLEG